MAKSGGWSVDLKTMKLSWTRETFRIADIDPPVEPDLANGINLFAPEARPTIAAAVQAAIRTCVHTFVDVVVYFALGLGTSEQLANQ